MGQKIVNQNIIYNIQQLASKSKRCTRNKFTRNKFKESQIKLRNIRKASHKMYKDTVKNEV